MKGFYKEKELASTYHLIASNTELTTPIFSEK
jgi:hypothetical protein